MISSKRKKTEEFLNKRYTFINSLHSLYSTPKKWNLKGLFTRLRRLPSSGCWNRSDLRML
jgi:hypothetical protein